MVRCRTIISGVSDNGLNEKVTVSEIVEAL